MQTKSDTVYYEVTALCLYCGVKFKKKRPRNTYCSAKCRIAREKALYREKNPKPSTSTGVRGAISELVVAADLLGKGYDVFRAVSPSASCDLAILRDGRLIRVEVTSGNYSARSRVMHPTKLRGKYDLLAIVMPDRSIIYRGLEAIDSSS